MKKLLFIFELHGSTDVVEFFRRNMALFHEKGYRNIGYELNQSEAERVLDTTRKLIGPDGRPSPRQRIHDLFIAQNPRGKITGLDVPELNELNRFILNLYLSHLFEQIHCVRDHSIFHQARLSSEASEFGSVNLVGCYHVGIMHQLIAYAVRENNLEFLKQCKFVFLVETGYEGPVHLFGTELPAYPLDVLVIDTKKGLAGTDKKLRTYLESPVRIPEPALLSRIHQEVDGLTKRQTQFYETYCRKLFQIFNAGQRRGISSNTLLFARHTLQPIISELAKHTLEAVNNKGQITSPRDKMNPVVVDLLSEAGFQFCSREKALLAAYPSAQTVPEASENPLLLLELPSEILKHILGFLDNNSMVRFAMAGKDSYDVVAFHYFHSLYATALRFLVQQRKH